MGSWRTNLKPPSCRPRIRVHNANSAGVSARRNNRERSTCFWFLPRNAAILQLRALAPHPGPLPARGAREETLGVDIAKPGARVAIVAARTQAEMEGTARWNTGSPR